MIFIFTHRLALLNLCMRNVKGHSAVIEMYVLLGTIVSLLTNLLTRLTTDNTLLILIIAFSYTLTAFLNYFNVN